MPSFSAMIRSRPTSSSLPIRMQKRLAAVKPASSVSAAPIATIAAGREEPPWQLSDIDAGEPFLPDAARTSSRSNAIACSSGWKAIVLDAIEQPAGAGLADASDALLIVDIAVGG